MVSRTTYARRFLVVVALICGALVAPAFARREVQEWHGFGRPEAASVDGTDGSVWAIIGTRVCRLSAAGAVLVSAQLYWPSLVAANPFDGSCWVLEHVPGMGAGYSLVQISAEGTVLCRLDGLVGNSWPPAVLAVSPNDGTCWIAWSEIHGHLVRVRPGGQSVTQWDMLEQATCVAVSAQDDSVWVGLEYGPSSSVVHLTPDAVEISRFVDIYSPGAVAVDPTDASVWAVEPDAGEVVHLDADGQELWRGRPFGENPSPGPSSQVGVAVDPTDHSCWVAGPGVVRISPAGEVVAHADSLEYAHSPSCSADGSLWVAAHQTSGGDGSPTVGQFRLYHLDHTGAAILALAPEVVPWSIAADPTDGSCWALDGNAVNPPPDAAIAQVSSAGAVLGRTGATLGGLPLSSLAINPQDGSFWVAAGWVYYGGALLAHLDAAGEEMFREAILPGVGPGPSDQYPTITSLSVDPSDGSCWIALDDPVNTRCLLMHFAPDGANLLEQQWPREVAALRVSAVDGSVWVANRATGELTHLSEQGEVLSQRWLIAPEALAVNARDGSVWVAEGRSDDYPPRLSFFGADASQDWHLPLPAPAHLAVDPATGFCWASQGHSLAIYSFTGQELWCSAPLTVHDRITLDPAASACWVVLYADELARLRVPLTPFGDVGYSNWARDEINACAEAGIVQGYPYGLYSVYHPDQPVTRDQMAAYLARAFAGGDGNVQVPSGVVEPTFTDVDEGHWAYRYIEYCAGAGLVEGYPSGAYQPDSAVTRDQMAVYIARALVGGDGNVPAGPAEAAFTDVATDYWAYDYIAYCASEGVVQGYPDGGYHPEEGLTRDQMAVFIARAYGLPLGWTTEW
jgi:DNA-binding beta-propeller fold protein YncE